MGLRRCGVLGLESSDLRLERLDVAGRGLEGLKLPVTLLDGIGESFLLGVQSVEVCTRHEVLADFLGDLFINLLGVRFSQNSFQPVQHFVLLSPAVLFIRPVPVLRVRYLLSAA